MTPRSAAARSVFAVSLCASLFWALGFVAERIVGAEPPLWSYAAPAVVVTGLFCAAAFRFWPQFLLPPVSANGFPWRSFAAWTIVAYGLGAVLVGGVSFVLLAPLSQSPEAMSSESSLAVVLLALWFPLWFAPAVGIVVAWWRQLRAESHSSPAFYADTRSAEAGQASRIGRRGH